MVSAPEPPVSRDVERLENQVAHLRRDRDIHKNRADRTQAENADLRARLDIVEGIHAAKLKPPKWLVKTDRKKHRVTLCSILSDCHWDEVVRAEEIGGINEYNRDVATERLKGYGQNLIKTSRQYLAGVEYDGLVLMLGGDMFSGTLHDLAETNEDTSYGSLLYWTEQLAGLIQLLSGEFTRVHIPVVVGNHGRTTRKPRTKLRARDNLDWLLGHTLAREFKGNTNVTFEIPDSADCYVTVYNTVHLLTHGDQVNGGQGVGGIWPPIKRMQAVKRIRQPHDVMVMGHWHQYISAAHNGLIINGSLKGYDEYAALNNFAPEPPMQAAWLVSPERGVTFQWPVFP